MAKNVLGGDLQLLPRLRADLGMRWEYNDFVQSAENTANIRSLDIVH